MTERWETPLEKAEETELVRQAKAGSREAFGELVRRHRAKVYGYAKSIVQEPAAAEDIVQDALIRAFLHVGKLADIRRFLPWLHRIVRNRAYSALQSKHYVRERNFGQISSSGGNDSNGTDWSSLEHIMQKFGSRSAINEHGRTPEDELVRAELLAMIDKLLGCLNERERLVFEAHFFEQLPPQEIARLTAMSSANVYQLISRSRKKLAAERARVMVDQYLKTRKDLIGLKKKVLEQPEKLAGTAWSSAGASLLGIINYDEERYSLPKVMGFTGLAFRIGIGEGDVHIAGPTGFDFKSILQRGAANMGLHAVAVSEMSPDIGPNSNLIDPYLLTSEAKNKRPISDALPKALELIQQSIDRGKPVMAWDLFIPEFGIVYGYDDESQTLSAVECGRFGELPYDRLGRGYLKDLFVLAIADERELGQRDRLRGALETIIDHYDGREQRVGNIVTGLEAYDAWMEAFSGGNIEPNGNAYNAAVVHEARQFAAAFLEELAASWQGTDEADVRIRRLCTGASALYRQLAEPLRELTSMFPFPEGGQPNDKANALAADRILEQAKALELQAVGLLRQIYKELN